MPNYSSLPSVVRPKVTPPTPKWSDKAFPIASSVPQNQSPINYSPAPVRPSAAIVRSQVAASNTPPSTARGGGGGGSWGPTTPAPSSTTPSPAASTTQTLSPAPVPNAQAEVARQNDEATRRLAALSSMQTPTPQQTPAPTPEAPKSSRINLPGVPQYSVSPELAAARQAALSAMRPGSEEDALAQQLAQFRGDTRMGLSRLEGQGRGIPLDLIRGQQAQLAEQAGIQEQTLMERLAAQQAQRQMAAQAAQAQLGFTQQDVQAQQAAQQAAYEQQLAAMKPQEIGGSLVQYNPESGTYETVYSSPAEAEQTMKPTATIQEYEYAKANGFTGSFTDYQQMQKGTSAGSVKAPEVKTFNNQPYQWNEATGAWDQISVDQVPTTAKVNNAQEIAEVAQALLDDKNLGHAVGPISQRLPTLRGGTADFENKFKQLQSLLTLGNIDLLKGVLSDSDMAILKKSATSLDLGMSEQGFRDELKRVIEKTKNIQASPQQNSNTLSPDEINYLKQKGWSDQDIENTYGSFPTDLGTSLNGPVQKVASAFPEGSKGGQCGRFVNTVTGIGMGDSYQNKMSFTDPSIGTPNNPPKAGDVFVMPYKSTGHTGIITNVRPLPDGSYDFDVIDSNYHLNEKVDKHQMNSKMISGYARVPFKPQFQPSYSNIG